MASEHVVVPVGQSTSKFTKKDRKAISLKDGTTKSKKKVSTPLGLPRNSLKDESSLEKLVLGETSGLFQTPAESPDKVTTLVPEHNANEDSKPAWIDEDPSELIANRVKRFETYHGTPEWAKLKRKRRSSSDEEDDGEVLNHAGNLLSRNTIRHASLAKGKLGFKRTLDLNNDSERNGHVTTIEFHPAATVGLVGDTAGDAYLYEVNGRTNPMLQKIHFQNFRIDCAKFATNGTEFLVGSRAEKHMFSYDMEAATSTRIVASKDWTNCKNFKFSPDGSLIAMVGRFGYIYLLTARSKELIGSLKMNSEVQAISFNSNGSRLYSHGDEGEIYVWDTQSRTCVERFHDEGCLSGVALATSGQYLATGCTSGVVNIYSNSASKRQPMKTVLNLVTPISGLAFNGSEEMLAMWSYFGDNGIRLVHLPSCTVFENFPGRNSDPVGACLPGQVSCFAFSPNGGYLAFGGKAQVRLLRLNHYKNY